MGFWERQVSKSIGAYSTDEVDTKQKWIDDKPIYRKVFDFGTLPNVATKSLNHNLTFDNIIKAWGFATDGSANWLPLPWVHTTTYMVQLWVTSTQIRVSTANIMASYSASWIVLEYTK